ncbi:YtxH domain-containing protein [Romboutsia sp. 13368]|jgi:gas vesicle protein|uniref:YtxH domain-containing protein n=1 Tax=Romboutsia sp. 13368 TaxID=2708053 RepID=UPI0025FC6D3E|nr:YtxH domain-containing protein [Romboutsia sp. 13368]
MSKRKGSFLLLGAFIGFIAGLFLAPKKGSELRKDAKNKIDEIKENPKEVLQGTFEDVKGKINDFIDDKLVEDDNIHISEDEIVISRTFNNEGESN